jgi:hypothetical protein
MAINAAVKAFIGEPPERIMLRKFNQTVGFKFGQGLGLDPVPLPLRSDLER